MLAHADKVGDTAHILAAACSFSSDTLVTTEQGDRPIDEIEVGDRVLAYDQATRSTGYYTVTALLVHEGPGIEYLTIDGEQLQTTPEHPSILRRGVGYRQGTCGWERTISVSVQPHLSCAAATRCSQLQVFLAFDNACKGSDILATRCV
ncbi:MAG TPA: Hint domain-containing protein [Chloroflexia bacterium]